MANKVVNDKQRTVIWNVDDLKVSHIDENENTKFAKWIWREANCSQRKNHDYLGMDIDWSKDGKITINMIKYLHISNFGRIHQGNKEDFGDSVCGLFVQNSRKVRCGTVAQRSCGYFSSHGGTAAFCIKRALRDIQTPVSFLTKRVKSPDREDWNELMRCLQYTKATVHMNEAYPRC